LLTDRFLPPVRAESCFGAGPQLLRKENTHNMLSQDQCPNVEATAGPLLSGRVIPSLPTLTLWVPRQAQQTPALLSGVMLLCLTMFLL